MRLRTWLFVGGAAITAAAPAWAADPVPDIAPAPAWVVAAETPAPDPEKADAPLQFLLLASQSKIRSDGLEQYVRYTAVAQNTVGLQALGQIMVPWNVERTDLALHQVLIRRGDAAIDILGPDQVTVLRRENNLEKAMLDGIRTVVVPARGFQAGDLIDVSFSYRTKPRSLGSTPDDIQQMVFPLPLARMERRFVIPDGVEVRWNVADSIPPAETERRDGQTEHRFVQTALAPQTLPAFTPQRFTAPIIQVSGYRQWSDVAAQLAPLFDQARRLPEASPVLAKADEIAAAAPDPETRMMAALRLAQDQVRYVALLLGEGDFTPASAEETWERRFGDCKGKTALLLALLDRLGIAAEPVLVSVQFNDRIGEMLPSLIAFDHVLVRAQVGGRSYYLDATDYGQRSLDEVAGSPFQHGLPLRAGAELEELPRIVPSAPHVEAELVWDGSNGLGDAVPFEATLVLRGFEAAAMRAKLAAATDVEEFDTGLKELVPRIPNGDLEIVDKAPEAADGSFTVRFAGEAEMDWSPLEGERNTRYAFTHHPLYWDVNFDRAEGAGKDLPVFLSDRPWWSRTTETVILPNGGRGYSIEGEEIDQAFAGSSASRSFRKEDDRITMVASLHHHDREISAEDARAAEPLIEELNEDYAYIVGPRERKKKRRRD